MTIYDKAPALQNLSLGKSTIYANSYDPTLLQDVPRSLNREELKLGANNLPFVGFDLWNIYELSWLNKKGKPVVATAIVKVPFDSDNLIESKSFKLYLNSFNQTQFDSLQAVQKILTEDLSRCASLDDLDICINNYQLKPEYLENISGSEVVSETLYSVKIKLFNH